MKSIWFLLELKMSKVELIWIINKKNEYKQSQHSESVCDHSNKCDMCERLYKSRCFGGLLIIQMCVNTIARRNYISSARREAVATAHQSGKGYKAIFSQFGVHHSTDRKLFTARKHSNKLPIFPGVDVQASLAQGQTDGKRNCKTTQELHLRLYRI